MSKLGKGVDNYYIRLSLRLYLEGMSFRGIECVVVVSHVSVMNGVKKYGKDLKILHTGEEKPIKAVEVDELHSYFKTKKNSVWVWLAVERARKRVLGFTIGDRSEMAGDRLCSS
ncbi:MAG: hypothetical protein GDA42_11405 [Ekhidna sp.]|nr:hypothetical protein [Ekhidna sp.]